jgi:hypothetical protein
MPTARQLHIDDLNFVISEMESQGVHQPNFGYTIVHRILTTAREKGRAPGQDLVDVPAINPDELSAFIEQWLRPTLRRYRAHDDAGRVERLERISAALQQ